MGVKQLWTLLAPVGRPVPLETLEGRILAIDSSIWLYQFQATMRDKDGRALVNAHILGFLRRISKLLFYGIKPVFIFDGGAPALKRNTITERKKRKSGAAASHAKVAEKLLAAQLRREALRHTEEQDKRKAQVSTPAKVNHALTEGNDNYLDDLSGPLIVLPGKHNVPTAPKTSPPKPSNSGPPTKNPTPSSAKKNFREHDPYRLPELDASIDARAAPNDPRLATDEELRAYISHLRPDDPEFHNLPADAQYEILGELRLKSRTTSHRRLQKMLRDSKTAMDFSMAQIKNLGQRNRLTQEVLSTLNIVGTGQGGVVVPVKIAGEKNREYVLMRNNGVDGGFTLGMRTEGNTADKPIVVEEDEEGDDSFDSLKGGDIWEDVAVPGRSQIGVSSAPDKDWRDFKRENALSGLAKRDTRKHLTPLTTKAKPQASGKGKGKAKELHQGSDHENDGSDQDLDDAQLQLAMQASLQQGETEQDEDEDEDVQRALALSLIDQPGRSSLDGASGSSSNSAPFDRATGSFAKPLGLLGKSKGLLGTPNLLARTSTSALPEAAGEASDADQDQEASSPPQMVGADLDEDDMEMEEVVVDVPQGTNDMEWEDVEEPQELALVQPRSPPASAPPSKLGFTPRRPSADIAQPRPSLEEPTSRRSSATRRELAQALSSSGEEDEEPIKLPSRLMTILAPYQSAPGTSGSPEKRNAVDSPSKATAEPSVRPLVGSQTPVKGVSLDRSAPTKSISEEPAGEIAKNTAKTPAKRVAFDDLPVTLASETSRSQDPKDRKARTLVDGLDPSEEDEAPSSKLQDIPSMRQTGDETTAKASSMPSWFTSAPTLGVSAPPKQDVLAELTQDIADVAEIEEHKLDEFDNASKQAPESLHDESGELIPLELSDEDDDIPIAWSRSPSPSGAVMVPVHTEPDYDSVRSRQSRVQAENEEHASFMSTLQNKPYASMRESLDAEIAALRKERAAALRDAEDVTAQMSAQIQVLLRLFGVPFVNAPMEAEAQCAFLARRGLVEGVITDDSDVFLFGAGKVFRNMFNQSKTVECFFSADLERELGLDRETLIGLAYLLGSDYTEGLPGVGPVVAMEIMKEFPGKDGLNEFRRWWRKVQVGKDSEADLRTAFRKRFKKKFKTLHLTEEWPNANVREAYLDPVVDQSEEKFQWGLPDLDGLRQFLGEELSWNTSKVDETILPIIHRMTQRSTASGPNKQGTLTSFIEASGAGGPDPIARAPRKKQAYASKRLQQVVAEYRARKSGENLEDLNEEAPEETDKPPKKRKPRAKAKGKGTQEAGPQEANAEAKASGTKRKRTTGTSTRGKRGAGRARGRGRGRGKSRASVEDEEPEFVSNDEESNEAEPEPEAPVPKKPRLRPRMKVPSPVAEPVRDGNSEGDSGSSDEYVED